MTLKERISAIQAEADAFLDERAKELSSVTPDVPLHVLRNILTARTYGCQCRAVLKHWNDEHVRENA